MSDYKVKVHKIEVLIVDFDELGSDSVKEVLETTRYPNKCIFPRVLNSKTIEVNWDDDHPLNNSDTIEESARKLFGEYK